LGWRTLKPYQQERLTNFFNPTADSLGGGYNLIQSKIAVGSGGFLGQGLGKGSQSQLRFLPERQSDFIFACLAEELGFVGAGALLVFYFLLFIKIIFLISQGVEKITVFVSVGAFSVLFFQSMVNIGMNLGLVPITGLTLPLVSYGGSSLIATLVLLGILQSIKKHLPTSRGFEIK
jgi:rod shape determining protein RodA